MEAFAIIGFIFSLPAFGMASASKKQLAALQAEVAQLKAAIEELQRA